MQLTINSYRGFKLARNVRVTPLTLLVGENSAGKTSFLALLRYIYASFSGPGVTFNREPFSLGAYEQIAHYRGGKGGRAKSFSYSISQEVLPGRHYGLTSDGETSPKKATLSVEFFNRFSQPALSSVSLTVEKNRTTLKLVENKYILSSRFEGESSTADLSSLFNMSSSYDDAGLPTVLSIFINNYSFLGRVGGRKGELSKKELKKARYFASYLSGLES